MLLNTALITNKLVNIDNVKLTNNSDALIYLVELLTLDWRFYLNMSIQFF